MKTPPAVLALGALLGLCACEAAEPGVAGTITLDDALDPTTFPTLHYRMVEDDGEPFDVTDADRYATRRSLSDSDPTADIEFPFEYSLGGGIGDPADGPDWRVVVWLSLEDGYEDWPAEDAPLGTATFQVRRDSCSGIAREGYCGITEGVDVLVQ